MSSEPASEPARDPVCGMAVDPATAAGKSEHDGTTYYFCSAGCRAVFEKEPARYLAPAGETVASQQGHQRGGVHVQEDATAVDPVCGMTVETGTAEYRSFHRSQAYYFCSAGCKQSFDKEPERYLERNQGGDQGH